MIMNRSVWVCLVITLNCLVMGSAFGADSASTKGKQQADSEGYAFAASHDEIVERAKKEGKLAVIRSLGPQTFKSLIAAFRQKYPFITEVTEFEFRGTEAPQRFLLELQVGRGKEWDVFDVAPELQSEFLPFLRKFDVLRMAKAKVLDIPIEMIDPKSRNVVSITAGLHAVAYNKKQLREENVPNSWEDFLKPELKGKKFMVEIRPQGFAALATRMGEQWMVNYAQRIKEQQPIWVRGAAGPIARIAAGEGTMYHFALYHTCMAIREKQLKIDDTLGCKVIQPVPIRIGDRTAVSLFASHPHVALLWVEFQASAQAQGIIDINEPLKSSLYVPGTEINKLVKGKTLSVNDWNSFYDSERWMEQAVKAFGFPQEDKR